MPHQSAHPRCVLSLFDYSGNWPKPYLEAGHHVVLIDIKRGHDILQLDDAALTRICRESPSGRVDGILMAPPCTDFSGSGAQYWPAKDLDGRTAASVALVLAALAIKDKLKPDWWALENPVGRLNRCVPQLAAYGPWWFQPYFYGDAYTKKTGLWGVFNHDLVKTPVEPQRVCQQGSWLMKLGGKSERTKELRSMTPMGFARAFFEANSWKC